MGLFADHLRRCRIKRSVPGGSSQLGSGWPGTHVRLARSVTLDGAGQRWPHEEPLHHPGNNPWPLDPGDATRPPVSLTDGLCRIAGPSPA